MATCGPVLNTLPGSPCTRASIVASWIKLLATVAARVLILQGIGGLLLLVGLGNGFAVGFGEGFIGDRCEFEEH
jgi:hypothetical protein